MRLEGATGTAGSLILGGGLRPLSCVVLSCLTLRLYVGEISSFAACTQATTDLGRSGICGQCALPTNANGDGVPASNIEVTHATLYQNNAQLNGGAFYIEPDEGCCALKFSMAFYRSYLIGNHADGAGGAVSVLNPAGGTVAVALQLRNCTVDGNSAGAGASAFSGAANFGGALALWYKLRDVDTNVSKVCQLSASDTNFTRNACIGGSGGAVMLISCTAQLERCQFVHNQATLSGGAVTSLHVGRSSAVLDLSTSTGSSSGGTLGESWLRSNPMRHRMALQTSTSHSDGAAHSMSAQQQSWSSHQGEQSGPPHLSGQPAQVPVAGMWGGHRKLSQLASAAYLSPNGQSSFWKAEVVDCIFSNNSAQLEYGGAVYIDASPKGQAYLHGCTLQVGLVEGRGQVITAGPPFSTRM